MQGIFLSRCVDLNGNIFEPLLKFSHNLFKGKLTFGLTIDPAWMNWIVWNVAIRMSIMFDQKDLNQVSKDLLIEIGKGLNVCYSH